MSPRIVVVDYHKGNLLSVARSVTAVGGAVEVSDDPAAIAQASGIILPGVGSFEDAMGYLQESGEGEAIVSSLERGVPFLGICLGLQLLFERGTERSDASLGDEWMDGLGLLTGSVTRLESSRLKVPHVGWNQLHLSEHGRSCPLFAGVPEGSNVYYTHSYAVADDCDKDIVAARTHYVRSFPAAVWRESIYGVQFHPEKSSATGLRILSNFVDCVRG